MPQPIDVAVPQTVDMEEVTARFLLKVGKDPLLTDLRLNTVLKMAELFSDSLRETQNIE